MHKKASFVTMVVRAVPNSSASVQRRLLGQLAQEGCRRKEVPRMPKRMRYALTVDGEYVKVQDEHFEHTGMYVVRDAW